MKNIIAIAFLISLSINAFAQKRVCKKFPYSSELVIGEYVGRSELGSPYGYIKIDGQSVQINNCYDFILEGDDEAIKLTDFINENKEKLGERLGLIFTKNADWKGRGWVVVYAVTPEEQIEIEKYNKKLEEKYEQEEIAKERRMNSLNNLL